MKKAFNLNVTPVDTLLTEVKCPRCNSRLILVCYDVTNNQDTTFGYCSNPKCRNHKEEKVTWKGSWTLSYLD